MHTSCAYFVKFISKYYILYSYFKLIGVTLVLQSHKFHAYISMTHNVYIPLCAHHPKSNNLLSPIFQPYISDVILNRNLFFFLFSDCTLQLYRIKIYFCVLSLYSLTLLNSFINSNHCIGFLKKIIYVRSYHLWKEIVWLIYNLDAFSFTFLPNCPSNSSVVSSGMKEKWEWVFLSCSQGICAFYVSYRVSGGINLSQFPLLYFQDKVFFIMLSRHRITLF